MMTKDIDFSGSVAISRRKFCLMMAGSLAGSVLLPEVIRGGLMELRKDEDLFSFMNRTLGKFDQTVYQKLIGAANEFKEGDQILGVAAYSEAERINARKLLSNTLCANIQKNPLFNDNLYSCLLENLPHDSAEKSARMTIGELKDFLLNQEESEIHPLLDGLCSDTIACVVKIMSNEELIKVGRKIFNPLAGTSIGAKGYMGARIQPNSPTDNPDDVIWQIFSAWSYAVGDVVLGVNPVSSNPESIAQLEAALLDIRKIFEIEDIIPHSVLAHIDIQAEVEKTQPYSTGIWFQSLAGSDKANATFDLTLEKMLNYAAQRRGKYGFYFETGQGADFTNGSGQGTDMVIHESRKYGFARLLKIKIAVAQKLAGQIPEPWVHVNDVAGFIGPEVFRTREQLVRCCLEDIVMGKLHELTIGLDICSTLHMDISLDDLDWCQDQIMQANPAYLMGLPTKNDPMLGYLTTAYQDHLRLRDKFGYKVNERMWEFFSKLGIIDLAGKPTENFGQPLWVWYKYRQAKGDRRTPEEIYSEGRIKMEEVRTRGVYLAEGFGKNTWDLNEPLDHEIRKLYADAKKAIWTEFSPAFISSLENLVVLKTKSADRTDYLLHPQTGEEPDSNSADLLRQLKFGRNISFSIQIVISDGLNANAIMDEGHLIPYVDSLIKLLRAENLIPAKEILLIKRGRVRAGYRIGEILFSGLPDPLERKGIIHIIGERPGTMHHTFSTYITSAASMVWSQGGIDHNITKVVSGIADTAMKPASAAEETVKIMGHLLKA